MKKLTLGGLYTPPSDRGLLMRPGLIGGANWGGGAFDPDTGILYVKTSNLPAVIRLAPPDESPSNPRADEVDADLVRSGSTNAEFMEGLPLHKPPYGSLTAIDLNRGELTWRVTVGDSPEVRNHPKLKGVALPSQLGVPGAPGAIVTKGGLVFVGGGDAALNAYDKTTGEALWRSELPRRTTGTPMTYLSRAGVQYIVIATGAGADASLVAFRLRSQKPSEASVQPQRR